NHPDLMQTHYFKAAEAAIAGKWVTAEQEIHRAEVLGLPHEVAQQFLAGKAVAESETETQSTVWRYAYYSLYAVAVWLAGLLLLFVSGKVLSGLTLHSIETDDPNDFGSKRHALLRKIYRVLINVGGFYYYISIPVVILLLLAVAGSVVYGSFMLGRIPIKLIAVIVIGALVTAFKMVQSLFVKLESGDPGRSIKVEEAPKLWDLARQVSGVVGTPVVDEIRMTPGTDLAVYQKSGSRRDSEDAGKKVLLVGAGILNGFSVNAFRAVLAHEYGHLSHRDTAGGEVALRVNANMRNFAIAMAQSGQAVWWNLGFWFLRIYHFIFRRLSYGATRLQEVLADRVAVLNYGAQAFEEGLRHVIRQSVEFEEAANSEIMSARQDRRTLRNLYGLEFATSPGVEDKVLAATNRSTTQDDTHPSPADRFRYASRIVSKPVSEIEGTVWDLFADREALTNEMSNTVNQRLRAG
ncbi:MAG TPA: M48 family metallopeptidase, partial [Blastocatellia bacterium]|nr:M48 family metallopeptidase [Blastocatellia bacterium]